jgi:NADH-quinone oxidoreductase subunit J
MITLAIFAFFAALAIVSAVLIIVQKSAMYSVLYLAFTVLSVAGVFFTLEAEYLGAIQILVYGGGIVVLYIFVIIIVNLDEVVRERRKLFPKIFIFAVPALLLGEIAAVLLKYKYVPAA